MKNVIQIMCVAVIIAALGASAVSADVGYLDEGSIVAWGRDNYGLVSDTPGGTDFAAVAAGYTHSLALKTDGLLVSWGSDSNGVVSGTPTGTGFVAVAAGAGHSVAIKADGSLVSWGSNHMGQVSDTPGGTGFTSVARGHWHWLALRVDGSLVSWGYDNYSQVSDTPAGNGFATMAAGYWHSVALKTDGSIVSWGRDHVGQVSGTPTGTGFAAVTAGLQHSLALRTDGSLVSWGSDYSGQVSDTPAGIGFAAVAAGDENSLALKTDGSIVAWGSDNYGQVSDMPISGYFLDIAAGYSYSLALRARQEYEDLVVTGGGARALLHRDVSVSGDCTLDTTLNGANAARMDVAGALVLEGGADFSGSGEIDAETIELNGAQVSANLSEATGLENHGQVSGYGAIAAEFHGASSSSITLSGGTLTAGDPASYSGFSTAGKLHVGDNTAVLQTKGFAPLGSETTLAGGTLDAGNGIVLTAGRNLAGWGNVDAKVSAGFGSTIVATGPLSLGDANAYDGFFSDGTLITGANTVTINDRNVAVLGSLTELGDGVDGGALAAGSADPADTRAHFLLEPGKNMVGRGSVSGNYKNYGDVIGDGTSAAERLIFNAPWVVSGKGSFTNTLILGTFSPGESPGITSGENQGFGGTVQVELGGINPGFGAGNHDQINDSGEILLFNSPALEILPWNDFIPEIGDEFVILTWQDGLDGAFGDVVVDPWFTDLGLDFDLHYNNVSGAGNLTIEATPEPATLSLLALGGLAVFRRKRSEFK